MSENYVMWNKNYEFNYDAIPEKLPLKGVS
jgi:hypothetical protein